MLSKKDFNLLTLADADADISTRFFSMYCLMMCGVFTLESGEFDYLKAFSYYYDR